MRRPAVEEHALDARHRKEKHRGRDPRFSTLDLRRPRIEGREVETFDREARRIALAQDAPHLLVRVTQVDEDRIARADLPRPRSDLRGPLDELHEYAARGARVEKGHHRPPGPRPRRVVEQRDPSGSQAVEKGLDRLDLERDVVDALTPLVDELRDGRVRTARLEQFDAGLPGSEERDPDAF